MTARIKSIVAQRAKEPPVASPFGTLAEIQDRAIANTLRFCGGNKPAAANMLGISLKTLYNRLGKNHG